MPTQYNSGSVSKIQHDFVLRIWKAGYNVIPISGKFPPCIKWEPYQTRRATPAEICLWGQNKFYSDRKQRYWSAPLLNFGLLTGVKPYTSSPGLIAIDSDDAASEAIITARCPPTPVMQRTGKQGWHRIYRRPAAAEYIPNRQKTLLDGVLQNIDVRGDGGYILAPGSIHPVTGRPYGETQPWSLELIEQAPIYDPTWIVDERSPTLPKSKNKTADIADDEHAEQIGAIRLDVDERIKQAQRYLEFVPGTQQGSGADAACCFLVGKLLWDFALPVQDALQLLAEWGERDDQLDAFGRWYPWSEWELERKINWILDHVPDEVGTALYDREADVAAFAEIQNKLNQILGNE